MMMMVMMTTDQKNNINIFGTWFCFDQYHDLSINLQIAESSLQEDNELSRVQTSVYFYLSTAAAAAGRKQLKCHHHLLSGI